MILSMKPLTLAEVKGLVDDLEERPELNEYIKKFCKLEEVKAKELIEELRDLKNHKLKEEFIVKIVDLLPKDSESLSKVFIEVSLDEKETNEVLEIVKKY